MKPLLSRQIKPLYSATLLACLILLSFTATAFTQEAVDTAELLEARIDSLRSEGSYQQAAAAAAELLRYKQSQEDVGPYELTDARLLAATLEQIAALPRSGRDEMLAAEHLTERYDAFYEASEYDSALTLIEKQVAVYRRLLGNKNVQLANALRISGIFAQEAGKSDRAETCFSEALSIDRRLLGDEHPDVAWDLANMGSILHDLGNYGEAERYYTDALRIYTGLFGEMDSDVAWTNNNLALLFKDEGKYEEAEQLYRKALQTFLAIYGHDDIDVANTMHNLARILEIKGNWEEAERLYREALSIYRTLEGEKSPSSAGTLINLANLLHSREYYSAAEKLDRQALALLTEYAGPGHPYTIKSLNNLAYLLHDLGDYAAAESLYFEALSAQRELTGWKHPDVAVILTNLARTAREERRYSDADSLYRMAAGLLEETVGPDHPHTAWTLYSYSTLLLERGRYDDAERILERDARAYERVRLRVRTGIERASLLKSPYPRLACARLHNHREAAAWNAAERDLGRALADLLFAAGERTLDAREQAKEDSLGNALSRVEEQLGTYQREAAADTTGEMARLAEQARNQLLALQVAWGEFQRGIAKKYPVTEGQAFPLERVQAALDDSTALIGWLDVRTGERNCQSWGYVIRSSGQVRWAPVQTASGDLTIDPFLEARRYRTALTNPASGRSRLPRLLWKERIAPLLPSLGGVSRLIAIPSGALLGIPIETFIDSTGVAAADRYTISYTPSATVHTWLSGLKPEPKKRRALLIGDPPFSAAQLRLMEDNAPGDGSAPGAAAGDISTSGAAPADGSARGVPAGDSSPASGTVAAQPPDSLLRGVLRINKDAIAALPRLAATRQEAASIAKLYPGSTLLLGPDASEQKLTALATSGKLGGFSIIHIATHAFVDDESPGRSALVLAQTGLPDPYKAALAGEKISDGLVTAEEILRDWHLDADLVTLSACETALGKKAGGEGYIGFSHAFLQAGARCLLVSLWKVEDRATSLLMRRFYENLSGEYTGTRNGVAGAALPPADALREAKRWLRTFTDDTGRRPYEHPFFWSAFILIGDAD